MTLVWVKLTEEICADGNAHAEKSRWFAAVGMENGKQREEFKVSQKIKAWMKDETQP